MAIYCPECGVENADEVKQCGSCGKALIQRKRRFKGTMVMADTGKHQKAPGSVSQQPPIAEAPPTSAAPPGRRRFKKTMMMGAQSIPAQPNPSNPAQTSKPPEIAAQGKYKQTMHGMPSDPPQLHLRDRDTRRSRPSPLRSSHPHDPPVDSVIISADAYRADDGSEPPGANDPTLRSPVAPKPLAPTSSSPKHAFPETRSPFKHSSELDDDDFDAVSPVRKSRGCTIAVVALLALASVFIVFGVWSQRHGLRWMLGQGEIGVEMSRAALISTLSAVRNACAQDPSGQRAAQHFDPAAFQRIGKQACAIPEGALPALADRARTRAERLSTTEQSAIASGLQLDPADCVLYTSSALQLAGCVTDHGFRLIHLQLPD